MAHETNWIKWGAIAIGAYWLYETYVQHNNDVFGSLISTLTGGTSPAVATSNPSNPLNPPGVAQQMTTNVAGQMVSNPIQQAGQSNPFSTTAGAILAHNPRGGGPIINVTPISAQSTPTVTTDAQLIAAASNPLMAYQAGTTMQDWDQWQYYAREGGGVIVDPSQVGIDRTLPITAAQYHQFLTAGGFETGARQVGIRGLSARSGWGKSPWTM